MFNLQEINLNADNVITNQRHKNLIIEAKNKTKKAKQSITDKMPIDIIAIEIKEILEILGTITGDSVTEDIIKEIFSKFCLGK